MFSTIGKPKKHNANPIPSFVVGCKSDLDEKKRMVTKYEAQAFAVKHGSRFVTKNFHGYFLTPKKQLIFFLSNVNHIFQNYFVGIWKHLQN